ncbi:RagB/SusD family nutrient uptake outer membrane protein [Pedobacter sp. GSP4]|uniref:RagB/SusD family nutrient uptake outer membrane protein n=1 Tax=Pedobacter sp. GSP4 TaxID=3453716 RepID=UPI003EED81F0
MKKLNLIIIGLLITFTSCKKYIDVVPDQLPTIQDAFANRTQAEKYLFTCYSYLPREGSITQNPAMLGGDELWLYNDINQLALNSWQIARGNQNVTSPQLNFWDGTNQAQALFRGIRDCNIFLENIDLVLDMTSFERNKWKAEVKFLKAYFHFYLLRMYGPIPLIKENLPVSATPEQVRVYRQPVDACVDYIVGLLDEAAPNLPEILSTPITDLGRITRPIDLAIKARVLLMAASPLFNGNPDYTALRNNDGTQLFNPTVDPKKWERALLACKEAITMAHTQNVSLYTFTPNLTTGLTLSSETARLLSIGGAVSERWNREIIWGASNSLGGTIQSASQPRFDPTQVQNGGLGSYLAPTLKLAELFYTKNGIPINEDNSFDFTNRYNLRTATGTGYEKDYIQKDSATAILHFDREPRFYADLGFDNGKWYGIGKFSEADQWFIRGKIGGPSGKVQSQLYSITGYYLKKAVYYNNVILPNNGGYQIVQYPWPVMRLADLYLMYAEAANEVNGPTADTYLYLDKVRERAGLKGVVESWATYSNNPAKPTTKQGLQQIIQQERLIEMAFEGSRFWDLRRWKTAAQTINNVPVQGWDIQQSTAEGYYRRKIFEIQKFGLRDYFWPITEYNITVNRNLVQNIGW